MSLLDDLRGSAEVESIERARRSDPAAFGRLYEQHVGAARRLARSLLADPSDADDVVADVFAAVFAALRRGRGPADDVRAYVLRSVRRECQRTWRRGTRNRPGGDVVVDLAETQAAAGDEFAGLDEADLLHRAFAALPHRQQQVLWLTEVDGLAHDAVAHRLGTTSANVAQLARRARLALGEGYLAGHLPDGSVPAACAGPRRALVEAVRDTASRRTLRHVDEHVTTCASCSQAAAELRVVNGRLRNGPLGGILPALAVTTTPGRIGLVARLVAWVAGPAPAMSAAATLAVVAAFVPVAQAQQAANAVSAATLPAQVEPVETVEIVDDDRAPTVPDVIPRLAAPVPASTAAPTAREPEAVAPAAPAPSSPAPVIPTTVAPVVPVVPVTSVPGLAPPDAVLDEVVVPVVTEPTGAVVEAAADIVEGVATVLPPLPAVELEVAVPIDGPIAATVEVGDVGVEVAVEPPQLPALPQLPAVPTLPAPLLGDG